MTDDYTKNFSINICIDKEKFIDITIPTLILTIPCGLSFSCLMSLMVYTSNKPLIRKKYDKKYLFNYSYNYNYHSYRNICDYTNH